MQRIAPKVRDNPKGKVRDKKGKGGGTSSPKGGCFNCGGAHYAANCPKGRNKGGKGVPTYSMNSSDCEWGSSAESIPMLGRLSEVPNGPACRGTAAALGEPGRNERGKDNPRTFADRSMPMVGKGPWVDPDLACRGTAAARGEPGRSEGGKMKPESLYLLRHYCSRQRSSW